MPDFLAVFFDPEYGGGWFPGLLVMILSGYVAAPAFASIGLVEVQRRLPVFQRSIIAASVAAMVMTFVAGAIWIGTVAGVAEDYSQHKTLYRVLPYLSLGVVAVAALFQYFNRQTFTRARGVAIACAAVLPIVVFIAGLPR